MSKTDGHKDKTFPGPVKGKTLVPMDKSWLPLLDEKKKKNGGPLSQRMNSREHFEVI
jgi:hypothetical protein